MKDREELLEAYNVLVAFQLWRRGAIEEVEPNTPQEIGEAIDTAAGVLWEMMRQKDEKTLSYKEAYEISMQTNVGLQGVIEAQERSLKKAEAANADLQKRLKEAEAERDKARAEVDDLVKKYFHDRAQEDADADPSL